MSLILYNSAKALLVQRTYFCEQIFSCLGQLNNQEQVVGQCTCKLLNGVVPPWNNQLFDLLLQFPTQQ